MALPAPGDMICVDEVINGRVTVWHLCTTWDVLYNPGDILSSIIPIIMSPWFVGAVLVIYLWRTLRKQLNMTAAYTPLRSYYGTDAHTEDDETEPDEEEE